ncbi:hypothetical protein HYFRA_00010071 [Hymenoscyphus fraxineus]|uniref:F-box domain-containing protein n=1 Tax=Hymenoscyphus fraxineus TaxID=746836 RepID=A0A9N9KX51_9HELO|nr:hypothetical protein HYFRA_00010071 [Hymenoscyphus fraxineus]
MSENTFEFQLLCSILGFPKSEMSDFCYQPSRVVRFSKVSSRSVSPKSRKMSASSSCTSTTLALSVSSVLPTSPPSTSYDGLPTPPPTPTKSSGPILGSDVSDLVTSTSKHVKSIPLLYTLPTEILLQVISYLPTAAYPSLIQTSHHLHGLFNNHASSIIATQIQTHHSHTASLLQATFSAEDSSGNLWLVPTHPSVLLAEEGMWDREGSVDTLQTLDYGPRTTMKQSLRLTQPGPQFLLFLERRGWEIDTRFAMMSQLQQVSSEERLQREEALSWALERYSIRPFLSELASFVDFDMPATNTGRKVETRAHKASKQPSLGSRMRNKFRGAKLTVFPKPTPPQQELEKRSLLFGEVEPEANTISAPTSPISMEKCTVREIESAAPRPFAHRHPFTDSLGWYFNMNHVVLNKGSSAPATVYDSEEVEDDEDMFELGDLYVEKGLKASLWRWRRGVEKKLARGKKSVGGFFKGLGCGSSDSLGSDVI